MSIKSNIDSLKEDQKEKIRNELTVRVEGNKYSGGTNKYIHPYKITDNDIYVPFCYSINNLNLKRRKREEFTQVNVSFTGKLREGQIAIKKETLDILNKTGSVIISLYTGGGKTITSINIACHIKMKTLVIVNKLILMTQWEESILKVCPGARVQILTPRSYMNDCDFYIINAQNVEKFEEGFFSDIGVLIVDELHLIVAEKLSKALTHIEPRYLIGLSATSYRTDGFEPLIELYFGKNKIIRELYREHKVFCVFTGFVPTVEYTKDSKLNWGSILNSQSEDNDRNDLIVNIVKKYPKRTFLIITKRVKHARVLVEKLQENVENVASLIGTEQEFDRDCRVLVGILQKCGTGFDFPKLDSLILACDLQDYFIQALGRVFRREDTVPYVFDLVDDNPILMRHYKNRKGVYIKHGGKICGYKIEDEGEYTHKRLI
jgi:superfamily II DNA or RNA helicase